MDALTRQRSEFDCRPSQRSPALRGTMLPRVRCVQCGIRLSREVSGRTHAHTHTHNAHTHAHTHTLNPTTPTKDPAPMLVSAPEGAERCRRVWKAPKCSRRRRAKQRQHDAVQPGMATVSAGFSVSLALDQLFPENAGIVDLVLRHYYHRASGWDSARFDAAIWARRRRHRGWGWKHPSHLRTNRNENFVREGPQATAFCSCLGR